MIKVRYDACIFVVLFFLNACSGLLSGSNEDAMTEPPTYRVQRVHIGALPTFFHSGTFTFITRFPLSPLPLVRNYDEPFLTVVGTQRNFSLYKGRPEDGLLLENQAVSYVLRSICAGQDAEETISPREGLFKCRANVPLCLNVVLSPLYTREITPETLGRLFLKTPPLKIEFEEIAPS